jgi:carboxyl-terminal processing protease
VPNQDQPQGEAVLTDLGRRVYSGGGITPDVKIPEQTASSVRGRLLGATFEFARYLVAGQFPGFREYKVDTVDYNHVVRGDEYKIPDKLIDAFRQFVASRQQDFPLTNAQITANIDYVRNRIREELITAAYGAEAGNQFFVQTDQTTQIAIASLKDAQQLAENAQALRDRQ